MLEGGLHIDPKEGGLKRGWKKTKKKRSSWTKILKLQSILHVFKLDKGCQNANFLKLFSQYNTVVRCPN